MAKRHTRHKRQKRYRRRTMKGGAFSQTELQQLQNYGFSQSQIESLQDLNVSFNEIMQKVNTIMDHGPDGFNGNSDDMTEQVMIELLNEHIFENPNAQQMDFGEAIPHAEDDIHNLDMSMDSSQAPSLNMSDLNTSRESGYTTDPDESFLDFGGKKRKKSSKNKKRGKKGRKTRKQKGGTCFGTGVGANSYDPNLSIYNTNMLKLFPYKP